MAKIQVLPDKLVNLIAAGEVIERPASVVKELVENSLDAGACRITIETAGGGRDFIRVTDDGCGIPKAELSLAVKRHATSKLQSVEQLWRISTLGFRGEALASISEVAHVELASKTPDSDVGWALRVSGGRQEGLEPSGLPQGTQVTVEDLFFNTPARAKYLGKQSGENRQIIKTVQDLALANPAVAFRLVVEGELRLSTPGDGSYLSAAGSIFGPEFAKKLITVSYQGEFGSIIGWVGVPGHYGSNRQGQVFAINGRVFRHTPFTYVVESVFKGRLPVRRFPVFMLNIQIDAAGVDVNVHPTKQEVKFRHE
ncbi:MAG: DNA mismatch repair endonuclease MutL, partial [Firmicutes bacterium]|nr:DNA mismatch repair endonuclease MutL [Bacillota bacterium]